MEISPIIEPYRLPISDLRGDVGSGCPCFIFWIF